jgi:hypothetical protein
MKTRPMSQWNVMRAYNRQLKLAFDEAGILFAGMMAAMPPQRATVHEITVKGATTTVTGDATDEALVQAALKAAAKTTPPEAPKAADAEARQAEGKGEPPAAANAPPSSPR